MEVEPADHLPALLAPQEVWEMSTTTSHHHARSLGGHDVRNAWLSALLLPLAFAAGFFAANGMMSALGYSGDVRVPPSTAAVVAIPAVLIVAVPAAVSSLFAVRAARQGDRRGWVPAALLSAIAVVFALQNLAAYLFSW